MLRINFAAFAAGNFARKLTGVEISLRFAQPEAWIASYEHKPPFTCFPVSGFRSACALRSMFSYCKYTRNQVKSQSPTLFRHFICRKCKIQATLIIHFRQDAPVINGFGGIRLHFVTIWLQFVSESLQIGVSGSENRFSRWCRGF